MCFSNREVTEWINHRCKGKSIFASIFAKRQWFRKNLSESHVIKFCAKILAKSYAIFFVILVYFHNLFSRKCETNFSRKFSEKFKNLNFPFNLSLTLVRFFVCLLELSINTEISLTFGGIVLLLRMTWGAITIQILYSRGNPFLEMQAGACRAKL